MSLAKKILGNTFIQMFGRVTTALMAIVAVKLITSTLGVEGYGLYSTVYEFLALFAIAGDFGIYTVALREMSSKLSTKNRHACSLQEEEKNKEVSFIYQNVLGLRIFLMVIFMGVAVSVAFLIPQYQGTLIPYGVLITSIAVFLNLVNSIVTSILQLHLKMTYATYALIFGKIVSIGVICYGAFFIESNTSAFFTFLIAGILGHLTMLFLSLFYAKKFTEILPKFDINYWKEIFKKAAPYGVALILSTIYFKVDVLLLSLLKGNENVGIYAVGIRVVEVFTVLPMFFMNSVLPSLTKAIEEKKEKLESILQLSFQFLLFAGLPIVIGSYLLSKFIIATVSSEEFLSGAKFEIGADVILWLLMLAMFFSFFSTFISICFVAFKKPKMVLFVNFIGVFVNVILNLIFIPKYGHLAAAITSIISEILIFFTGFLLFQTVKKFSPEILRNLKIFVVGILMLCFGLLLRQVLGEGVISDLLIGVLTLALYLGLVFKLKVVDKKALEKII